MRPSLEVSSEVVKVGDGVDPLHDVGAVGVAEHVRDARGAALPHPCQARRVEFGITGLAVPVCGLEALERAVGKTCVGTPVAAEAGDGVKDFGDGGVPRVSDPVPVPAASC